jgi:hypothetical protein
MTTPPLNWTAMIEVYMSMAIAEYAQNTWNTRHTYTKVDLARFELLNVDLHGILTRELVIRKGRRKRK